MCCKYADKLNLGGIPVPTMATPLIPTIIIVDRNNIIVFQITSFIWSTRLYISRLSQGLRLPMHYKLVLDIPFNGILLWNNKSKSALVLRGNSSLTQHVQQWEYILNHAFVSAHEKHGVWINAVLVSCCTASTAEPSYGLPYQTQIAVLNWFRCRALHVLKSRVKFGTWRALRLNQALVYIPWKK